MSLLLVPSAAHAVDLETVLDRHAAALGWDRQPTPPRALHMRATIEGFGLSGTLETWTEPPLRIWTKLELGPFSVENGFTGTDAWVRGRNQAVRTAVAAEETGLLLDAIVQGAIYLLHDPGTKLELAVDQRPSGEIALRVAPEGRAGQVLLLDPTTWRITRTEWQGSLGVEQTRYDDYRPVDGVWFPHQLTMEIGEAMELVAKVDEYEFTTLRGERFYRRPTTQTEDVQWSGSQSQALPMRGMGAHVMLMGTIGERSGPFLLDSGAGGNVLSDSVAEELGLLRQGSVEASGVAGVETATFVDVEKVDVGNISLLGQNWMSLNFDEVAAGLGADIIGVLGYDTFQRLVVEIDYQDRWVKFHDPAAYEPPSNALQLSIRLDANIPTAQVEVDGIPAWVHVDTGSDNTLDLSATFVERNQLQEDLAPLGTAAVIGLGGIGRTQRVELGELRVGPYDFEELETFVHQSPTGAMANTNVAGVLGAGILSQFHCAFDYSRSTLWLIPNRNYVEPVAQTVAGLTVRARRHHLVVTQVSADSPAATAGIQRGDRILAVNNRSLRTSERERLVEALDGALGRSVKLRVDRDGVSRFRRLLLPRD